MKTENEIEGVQQENDEATPRKLLLGKRVIRHFNVRTSIQTGEIRTDGSNLTGSIGTTGGSTRFRCF